MSAITSLYHRVIKHNDGLTFTNKISRLKIWVFAYSQDFMKRVGLHRNLFMNVLRPKYLHSAMFWGLTVKGWESEWLNGMLEDVPSIRKPFYSKFTVFYTGRTAFDLNEEVLPQKCTENKIINYKVVTTFRSAGIKKKVWNSLTLHDICLI